MRNQTLLRIERRLASVQRTLLDAAADAETLNDQGLADDLHQLRGELTMRILPSVRKGRARSTTAASRT